MIKSTLSFRNPFLPLKRRRDRSLITWDSQLEMEEIAFFYNPDMNVANDIIFSFFTHQAMPSTAHDQNCRLSPKSETILFSRQIITCLFISSLRIKMNDIGNL